MVKQQAQEFGLVICNLEVLIFFLEVLIIHFNGVYTKF